MQLFQEGNPAVDELGGFSLNHVHGLLVYLRQQQLAARRPTKELRPSLFQLELRLLYGGLEKGASEDNVASAAAAEAAQQQREQRQKQRQ